MISVTPLTDGVSELYALLPSVHARQVYDTANAVVMAAGASDVRTMDQRRADALIDLLTGRAAPPQVSVQVVVPARTVEPCVPGILMIKPTSTNWLLEPLGGRI